MRANGKTVEEILERVPVERREAFQKLHQTIVDNLPEGFQAGISYGGLGYVVPHSVYPDGYHCKPEEPLPFAGIASQKHSINFYHMGLYTDSGLLEWFVAEYPKHNQRKLDMGKSCVRFKNIDALPYELIGQLMRKMTAKQWIEVYERELKK